jgi:predicted  nucleic acid-binding Zn-ribbon protein
MDMKEENVVEYVEENEKKFKINTVKYEIENGDEAEEYLVRLKESKNGMELQINGLQKVLNNITNEILQLENFINKNKKWIEDTKQVIPEGGTKHIRRAIQHEIKF